MNIFSIINYYMWNKKNRNKKAEEGINETGGKERGVEGKENWVKQVNYNKIIHMAKKKETSIYKKQHLDNKLSQNKN